MVVVKGGGGVEMGGRWVVGYEGTRGVGTRDGTRNIWRVNMGGGVGKGNGRERRGRQVGIGKESVIEADWG